MVYEPRRKIEIAGMSDVTTASETQVFTAEEIRDAIAHNSTIANCTTYSLVTIFVDNTLDQVISVQVYGNRANTAVGAVTIGAPFNVAINDQEARTLDPTDEGYLPYIFVEITAAGVPTLGDVDAYIVRKTFI